MDLKPVEPEGLAGIQELRRAGSTQIQLGRCRTRLDPGPMHSSPGLSPCRASPAALALLPFPGVPQGAVPSQDPTSSMTSPPCIPKPKPTPRAPLRGWALAEPRPLSPGNLSRAWGAAAAPGRDVLSLPLRVPCPGLAAPPAARLRHHPGLAPAFLGHQSLQEEQERLGLHRTAPGCAPAVRPGSLPLPGRGVSFHLRWEWCSPRPVLEKSRAKRSSKAGRGQGEKREAKMAFCSFVLGWKGP